LLDKKKIEIINKKHNESHVKAHILFHLIFHNEFYSRLKTICKKIIRGCEECLKYNVGRMGLHLISIMMATFPFNHVTRCDKVHTMNYYKVFLILKWGNKKVCSKTN
jgi:hypothetical protein